MLSVKGAIIVHHTTPPHGKENGHSIPDDSEKRVALQTAASPGLVPVTTVLLPHAF